MANSSDIERFNTDVKGAVAESLVTMLFRRSGFSVKLFGRWKAGDIDSPMFQDDGGLNPETDHPDLIINRKKKRELIEVKYRKYGFLKRYKSNEKLKTQCLYWSEKIAPIPLHVIIVNQDSEPYFSVLSAPYISAKTGWFLERIPLMEAGWDIDPALYDECVRLLKAGIFNGVNE